MLKRSAPSKSLIVRSNVFQMFVIFQEPSLGRLFDAKECIFVSKCRFWDPWPEPFRTEMATTIWNDCLKNSHLTPPRCCWGRILVASLNFLQFWEPLASTLRGLGCPGIIFSTACKTIGRIGKSAYVSIFRSPTRLCGRGCA